METPVKKEKKCPYASKGCKCTDCKDCKENAKREKALHNLTDNPEDI